MFQLNGRVALVTGAGRGIGKAIALALAEAGARVALSARTTSELDETAQAIRANKGEAFPFSADLEKDDVPYQLAKDVAAKVGPIDILVNNAGLGSSSDPRSVLDFDDTFWERSIKINLTAPYKLCKAVLPHMLSQKWGRIIQVASINGKVPSLHGAAYTASKHGILGLTKVLALEVAKEGITVNAICPGPVKTLMNDRRIAYDAQRRGIAVTEVEVGMTPMGTRLDPEDIAPMAVYLASDEAKRITGQAYNIDAGVVMGF